MMDKETLKIAYLAGNNDSLEAEINDVILEYFESWYEKTGRSLVKKSNDIHNVSKSCFCGAAFNGIECNSCGFDASEVDVY